MARPVQYNIYGQTDVKLVKEGPEGHTGEGFFATKLSEVVGLARKNSIWPLPFATSCCGIEFMATMGAHYDLARFGSERVGFSPRQCDLLMVMGTIAKKMGPVVKQVYLQMAEPRGCWPWAPAPAVVAFSTLTAYYKVLTRSFPWMYIFRAALRAPKPCWTAS